MNMMQFGCKVRKAYGPKFWKIFFCSWMIANDKLTIVSEAKLHALEGVNISMFPNYLLSPDADIPVFNYHCDEGLHFHLCTKTTVNAYLFGGSANLMVSCSTDDKAYNFVKIDDILYDVWYNTTTKNLCTVKAVLQINDIVYSNPCEGATIIVTNVPNLVHVSCVNWQILTTSSHYCDLNTFRCHNSRIDPRSSVPLIIGDQRSQCYPEQINECAVTSCLDWDRSMCSTGQIIALANRTLENYLLLRPGNPWIFRFRKPTVVITNFGYTGCTEPYYKNNATTSGVGTGVTDNPSFEPSPDFTNSAKPLQDHYDNLMSILSSESCYTAVTSRTGLSPFTDDGDYLLISCTTSTCSYSFSTDLCPGSSIFLRVYITEGEYTIDGKRVSITNNTRVFSVFAPRNELKVSVTNGQRLYMPAVYQCCVSPDTSDFYFIESTLPNGMRCRFPEYLIKLNKACLDHPKCHFQNRSTPYPGSGDTRTREENMQLLRRVTHQQLDETIIKPLIGFYEPFLPCTDNCFMYDDIFYRVGHCGDAVGHISNYSFYHTKPECTYHPYCIDQNCNIHERERNSLGCICLGNGTNSETTCKIRTKGNCIYTCSWAQITDNDKTVYAGNEYCTTTERVTICFGTVCIKYRQPFGWVPKMDYNIYDPMHILVICTFVLCALAFLTAHNWSEVFTKAVRIIRNLFWWKPFHKENPCYYCHKDIPGSVREHYMLHHSTWWDMFSISFWYKRNKMQAKRGPSLMSGRTYIETKSNNFYRYNIFVFLLLVLLCRMPTTVKALKITHDQVGDEFVSDEIRFKVESYGSACTCAVVGFNCLSVQFKQYGAQWCNKKCDDVKYDWPTNCTYYEHKADGVGGWSEGCGIFGANCQWIRVCPICNHLEPVLKCICTPMVKISTTTGTCLITNTTQSCVQNNITVTTKSYQKDNVVCRGNEISTVDAVYWTTSQFNINPPICTFWMSLDRTWGVVNSACQMNDGLKYTTIDGVCSSEQLTFYDGDIDIVFRTSFKRECDTIKPIVLGCNRLPTSTWVAYTFICRTCADYHDKMYTCNTTNLFKTDGSCCLEEGICSIKNETIDGFYVSDITGKSDNMWNPTHSTGWRTILFWVAIAICCFLLLMILTFIFSCWCRKGDVFKHKYYKML